MPSVLFHLSNNTPSDTSPHFPPPPPPSHSSMSTDPTVCQRLSVSALEPSALLLLILLPPPSNRPVSAVTLLQGRVMWPRHTSARCRIGDTAPFAGSHGRHDIRSAEGSAGERVSSRVRCVHCHLSLFGQLSVLRENKKQGLGVMLWGHPGCAGTQGGQERSRRESREEPGTGWFISEPFILMFSQRPRLSEQFILIKRAAPVMPTS